MNLLIALLNTLAIFATLGLLIFTKIMYKKPKITEASEKKHLAVVFASPKPPPVPALIKFEPITVNIAPTPPEKLEDQGSGPPGQDRLHYITVGFSLEIGDATQTSKVEGARPFILDQIISLLGKKKAQELSTVQGRYILKSQLLDILNQKLAELNNKHGKDKSSALVVTNLFFEEFIVQ